METFKVNSAPAEPHNQGISMRAMRCFPYVVAPQRDAFPSCLTFTLESPQFPRGFGSLQSTLLLETPLLNGTSTHYFNPCKAKIRSTAQRFLTSPSNLHMKLNYWVTQVQEGQHSFIILQPPPTKNKLQAKRKQVLLAAHGKVAIGACKGIFVLCNSII